MLSSYPLQSRPGRPGRFALQETVDPTTEFLVSIPTGPPRPFRRKEEFKMRFIRNSVSIPTGPPRPFRLITVFLLSCKIVVFQSRPGRPGRFAPPKEKTFIGVLSRFNPDRAAQAVSPHLR